MKANSITTKQGLQSPRPLGSLALISEDPRLHIRRLTPYFSKTSIVCAAILMFVSIFLPTLTQQVQAERYSLTPETSKLVGSSVQSLLDQLNLDEKTRVYNFNAGYTSGSNNASVKAGQFRASLATTNDHAITIDDPVSNITVKLIPKFGVMDGKKVDGHILYPASESSTQAVYSLKSNGLKEDVVLPYFQSDTKTLNYSLVLPAGVEARLEKSGDIGIYSADSKLFGNVSTGSDADQKKLDLARQKSAKTNLVFSIPAPIIKDKNGKIYSDKATFNLEAQQNKTEKVNKSGLPGIPSAVTSATFTYYSLTVNANKLRGLEYPISIDPSIRVTSASDFRKGNNEGVDFDDTNGQILRPGLTGGTLQALANDSHAMNNPRNAEGVAVYNNCVYAITGVTTSGSYTPTVEYSTIDSSGNMTNWTNTSSTQTTHTDGAAVAYNGYLYILEGNNGGGGGGFDHNEYVKINSDCSLGTWADTTVLQPSGIGTNQGWRAAVYNGYVYVVGGWNGAIIGQSYYDTIYYAKQNADGTLGSWTLNTNHLPEARHQHGLAIYNGFMYVVGGNTGNLSSPDNSVKFAKIGSDGSVGTFTATTALASATIDLAVTATNGYLYATGGNVSGSAVANNYMAPIYANGSIGTWQATSSLVTAVSQHGLVITNGYTLVIGGTTGAAPSTAIQKGKISVAGSIGTYNDDTTHTLPTGSWGAGITVYDSVIYVVGGCQAALATCESNSATDYLNTVYHATINGDGTLSSWTTDTALPTSETGIKAGRFGAGVVAYNGYLYVAKGDAYTTIGGQTQKSDVLYSKIRSDGVPITPGCSGSPVWCVAATDTVAQGRMATVVFNGWLYMIGGDGGAGGSGANQGGDQTRIAQLKSDGSINGFSYPGPGGAAVTLDNKVLGLSGVVSNGYLYVFGGRKSTGGGAGNYISTVESIKLNNDGTFNGSWTNVGSMPNIKAFESAVVNNGYVYITGGVNKINTTFTIFNDTTFARLKSDGTLDTQTCSDGTTATWCTTNSMAATRFGAGGVVSGGNLYEIGGCEGLNGSDNCNPAPTSNYAADIEYAPINNGGAGGIGTWTAGNTITARGEHGSVVLNGYLYVMGGCVTRNAGLCKGLTNNIQYAAVNADGSLGSWSNTTNGLPSNLSGFFAVAYNGRIYISGGCTTVNTLSGGCTASTTGIFFVAPTGTGDITASWTSNGNSPGTSNTPLVVYNGYMYNLGANATTNGLNYYAAINASTNSSCTGAAGLICSWSSTSSLNTPRGFHSAIYYNGYIYVFGGTVSNVAQNSIEYAKIKSDHTLDTWTQLATPWIGRQTPVLTAYDGNLCTIAGYNPALGFLADTWCASVINNGSLDSWRGSTTLSQGLASPGGAQSGSTFYVTGGENGSAGNDVQAATNVGTLRAIPRIGHYSRVFDMDRDIRPTKFIAAGSMATDATVSLNYSDATNSGLTFNNLSTNLSGIGLGSDYSLDPVSPHDPARYHFFFFTFDDNLSATFPDASSSPATINDFDFYFNPNTSRRLRNGTTFIGETKTGVDAQP